MTKQKICDIIEAWTVRKMPKTYQINEEQKKEIDELKNSIKDATLYKKLEVLSLRASGTRNEQIAKITGYSKSRVSALVCEYAKNGMGYFKCEHRIGGNRRNMPIEQEKEFLKQFEMLAEKGQIITIEDIYHEYLKTYKNASKTTIYKLLKRHGWRKIMPRSRHPKKASEEAIEASKKLKIDTESSGIM